MDSVDDTAEAVGCPIRKSTDQGLLAAPHGLSQRAASFIASQCQGIHQMPFRRLISTYECATRRSKPTRTLPPSPQPHPAKMHHMTQPTLLPLPEDKPCRVILGHFFSSHVKDPIPARRRISVFSLIGYLEARSLKVINSHCSSRPSSWWRRTGSNRRPHACKARALPTELRPHGEGSGGTVVGQGRLELPTSRLSSARSNQLSY